MRVHIKISEIYHGKRKKSTRISTKYANYLTVWTAAYIIGIICPIGRLGRIGPRMGPGTGNKKPEPVWKPVPVWIFA